MSSDVQQANNDNPVERTKRKKRQLKNFQGTQLQESVESQFELRSQSQWTIGQKINIFYGNFLHLLSFLQQKLFNTFSWIGFQTMSLKRTLRYSIFLISFITSVSFLNLNLVFNSIDRSSVDTGLRLVLLETFRRRSDVMNVFWAPNVRQIYVQWPLETAPIFKTKLLQLKFYTLTILGII